MTQDNFGTNKKSSRGRTPEGDPNPVDIHVGKRIRLRREVLGLSQEKVAAKLGLTFQQIQKYERGMNRIGASRLWDFGQILNVPIAYFFDEMSEETSSQSPRRVCGVEDDIAEALPQTNDPMQKAEALQMVRAYNKIPNRSTAKALFELIMKMSKAQAYLGEEADESEGQGDDEDGGGD